MEFSEKVKLPTPRKLLPGHPYLSLVLSFFVAIGFSPIAALSNFAFAGAVIIAPSLLYSIIATEFQLPTIAVPDKIATISLNQNDFIKVGFALSLIAVVVSWIIEVATKGRVRIGVLFMRLRIAVIFIGWSSVGVMASLSAKPADLFLLFFFVGLAVFFTVVTLLDYMVGYARSFL